MSHTIKTRVVAGVLGAGVVAGLIATVPGTAFAASRRADATTATTASSASRRFSSVVTPRGLLMVENVGTPAFSPWLPPM